MCTVYSRKPLRTISIYRQMPQQKVGDGYARASSIGENSGSEDSDEDAEDDADGARS